MSCSYWYANQLMCHFCDKKSKCREKLTSGIEQTSREFAEMMAKDLNIAIKQDRKNRELETKLYEVSEWKN